jgi:probable F420-dependent oxidoreductase
MQIWVVLPSLQTDRLTEIVSFIESLSVDGIAISDHVCVPDRLDSEYPYTGKRAVLPADTEFPDPVCVMAALGATSQQLRFMTYVLLASLRHPILLGKALATASVLTGGRVEVAAGVGWMREEFDAIGVPFEERGSRLDETLPLLRELWSGVPVRHQGRHFTFESLVVSPFPTRPIPLFVGGHSAPALRRAARLADGWVGVNPTLEELRYIVGRLAQERVDAGRDEGRFEIRSGIRGRLEPADLEQLREIGVDGIIVAPWQTMPRGVEPSTERLREHLPELVARVRTACGSVDAA